MGGVSMEWKEVIATDYCYKVADGTHDSPKRQNRGRFLITSKHIKGPSIDFDNAYYISEDDYQKIIKRSKIDKWDVIVSMIGEYCGFCYLEDSDFTDYAVKNVGILKVGERIKSLWLYYYLNSPDGRNQLKNTRAGSSQPYISLGSLRNLLIPEPPRDVMERTVSILSSLDRKIELNNKINADLEEMAQAIFKNWLSECSDDVTIGELSLNITNYEKTDAEEVVLINSSDVTEGYFDHHNYSPNKNLKGHFKKRFQKGDILYSQVRPRNRHWAYCNFDANDYLASTQLMVIRNNPSLITSILLYQYIISDNVWKEFTLKTETRSGTFPQGNYEDLSQIRVPYNSDVEGISNQLETLYAKMFMLEKENSRLSLLRDTLLPRLMSGELEVPE